jgi:protein-tyrosine phosphatase
MYTLHWITEHLATGHAPMSYEDLDAIRAQGIGAIVNLCGEFCDLHQIEEGSGFEVYYLPVVDECAPDLAALEKGLDFLDEAIYLNKKVLVHCRLGYGRTGTFIAAYLLRRGFDLKRVEQIMQGKNANPATYQQRRFLKQYGDRVGPLRTAKPRIDHHRALDISSLLQAYATLIARYDQHLPLEERGRHRQDEQERERCCQPFDLLLIESMHLSQAINQTLHQKQRQQVTERALVQARRLRELHCQYPGLATRELAQAFPEEELACPLLESGSCLVAADRPLCCRYGGGGVSDERLQEMRQQVVELSRQAYWALTGREMGEEELRFSLADTISGKFVQLYFQAITQENR